MKKIRKLPLNEYYRLRYVPNAPDGRCYFFTDPTSGIEYGATKEDIEEELKEIRKNASHSAN